MVGPGFYYSTDWVCLGGTWVLLCNCYQTVCTLVVLQRWDLATAFSVAASALHGGASKSRCRESVCAELSRSSRCALKSITSSVEHHNGLPSSHATPTSYIVGIDEPATLLEYPTLDELDILTHLHQAMRHISTWDHVTDMGGDSSHPRWSAMNEAQRAAKRQTMLDNVWEIHRDVEHALLHVATTQ